MELEPLSFFSVTGSKSLKQYVIDQHENSLNSKVFCICKNPDIMSSLTHIVISLYEN